LNFNKTKNDQSMTIPKQNKLPTIIGTAILTIALAYGGTVFASHSFEAGVKGDIVPDNTHIRLDGVTLQPGTIFPLYDSSPNYVAGHLLLKAPCIPVDDGDDTYKPTITVVAGHVDEHNDNTHMEKMPLFYIAAVSNPPHSCIWHAHFPDPLNGGSPRVTDIDMVNLHGEPIMFSAGDVVDLSVQRVLGTTSGIPYTGGPVVILEDDNEVYNPVFDLNDEDEHNDGLGHSSQIHGGAG
jgi:hypothetical protein